MNNQQTTIGVSSSRKSEWSIVWWVVGVTIIALALLARNGFAQAPPVKRIAVHGTVVDSASGQPLAGAFISLDGDRWGTVTNKQGKYTLRRVEPGHITVSVNQLGYQGIEWKGVVSPSEDTVNLAVPPKPKLLKGLKVLKARLRRRRDGTAASVVSFNEQQLARTTWSNVVSFIDARAGLNQVSCYWVTSHPCYLVNGEIVSPIVYINEVEVPGGMSQLESMWPQDLYMLEVYGQGAEIRVYTKPFMKRAARTDFHPMAIGF